MKMSSLGKLLFTLVFLSLSVATTFAKGFHETKLSHQAEHFLFRGFGSYSPQNIVKLNLSSLVFSTFSLQYERLLTGRLSIAMGVRITPQSGIPLRSTVMNYIKGENGHTDQGETILKDTRKSGFALTPEVRIYLGKHAGKGFYLAPFARYEHATMDVPYLYHDNEGGIQNIAGHLEMNAMGIGLLLGAQFNLGKYITLDCWFLGPYYNHYSVSVTAGGLHLSAKDQQEMHNSLSSISVLNIKPDNFKVDATSITAKANFGLPVIRGLGFCLGFRF